MSRVLVVDDGPPRRCRRGAAEMVNPVQYSWVQWDYCYPSNTNINSIRFGRYKNSLLSTWCSLTTCGKPSGWQSQRLGQEERVKDERVMRTTTMPAASTMFCWSGHREARGSEFPFCVIPILNISECFEVFRLVIQIEEFGIWMSLYTFQSSFAPVRQERLETQSNGETEVTKPPRL